MKNFTTCICIMGLSGVASAQLIDQIGPDDGTGIGANITGCQDFEAGFDIYDINTMDNFTGSGETINSVEMVLNGWNGFIDPSSVTGYTANVHSTPTAASTNLAGDVGTGYADAATCTTSATWAGAGFVVAMPTAMYAGTGEGWISMVPSNEFATGGQTGVADALVGDGVMGWQANPGGGFGMPGNMAEMTNEAAYRIFAGAGVDPCTLPLADLCPSDVDGDGSVAVSDILAIIGQWGQCGDGTFRPSGDVAPLPNGDCCVTVADVLAVVGSWGADCTVYGACCYGDGMCDDNSDAASCAAAGGAYFGDGALCIDNTCVTGACCLDLMTCADMTADGCVAAAGSYKGDGTACATTDCSDVIAGDECISALAAIDGANPFDTTGMTADINLPSCAADAGAFGWTVPTNDIWFMWTATNTNDYFIDTCDALSFDTSVVVYDACGGADIACNGDGPADANCQQYHTAFSLSATAGSTYYIRIGGFAATDLGTGTLNINEAAPGACCVGTACTDSMSGADCAAAGGTYFGSGSLCATTDCDAAGGDECADAITVVDGANAFDTSAMTPSTPDPDDTQCAGTYLDWGTGNNDGWYMYVATGGMTTFDTCDAASFDTSIVLYEGSCATQVACNGDTSSGTGCQAYSSGIENFDCVAGQTYYVRIGAWNGGGAGGAGTLNISPPAVGFGACCLDDGSCLDVDASDCVAFGGDFIGDAILCSSSPCPEPYGACPAGADMQCDACWVDGDDSSLDCNAGLNGATGTELQAISLGVPMCGTGSVYFDPNYDLGDGTFGATLRDMDWFSNASVNAGGTFTVTAASSGMEFWVLLVDMTAGTIVDQVIIPGNIEGSLTFTTAAGNYSLVAAPNAWDLTWICGSGMEEYRIQLD